MRADDLPDNIKRLNPQIFNETAMPLKKRAISGGKGLEGASTPPNVFPQNSGRLVKFSENAPKLNKTEARFAREWLARYCAGFKECFVVPQPTRFFRLTGGGTYTPDFLVLHEEGASVYEVKMAGAHYHGWEQGYERYKRAAFEFSRPWLSFVMATWQGKLNAWKIETWEYVK